MSRENINIGPSLPFNTEQATPKNYFNKLKYEYEYEWNKTSHNEIKWK